MTDVDMKRRDRIASVINAYFDACNRADFEGICGHFTPDAIHYFPAGTPFGSFVGREAIAHGWIECVRRWNSRWTIDRMIIDPATGEAVIEWTHFQPSIDRYIRGDEWYRFSEADLIEEIRAYYACPASQPSGGHELGGFPYADRGYPLAPPVIPDRPLEP